MELLMVNFSLQRKLVFFLMITTIFFGVNRFSWLLKHISFKASWIQERLLPFSFYPMTVVHLMKIQTLPVLSSRIVP
ncbi:hypothetical protein Gohar_025691 [Gossypium harknessii]|uniref:Uncharacterized protein n=1 Tax=Gossypium harknessii TaxID=34285 RepID=A0A7J9IA65_9ROSI|nr:hypothetical protein [Gossypium harknessii]